MNNQKSSGLRLALVAATLLTVSAEASALWGDQLELFVSDTIAWDSNVFRISDARDAGAFIGSSERGDTINTLAAGFNLDMPISRQRIKAGASWNNVRYNRFTDLNFNGHDANAVWLWQLADRLNGQIGMTDSEALASFTNFQGRNVNPLKTQRTYANATYMLTPSWELAAGAAETRQRNGAVLRQDNDLDLTETDAALTYVSAAGNRLGLAVRQQEGRYPSRQIVLFDNAYTQRSAGIVLDWTPTGKSRFNARVDRVHREYEQFSQRDFKGTTGRVVYDWSATGKFTLTAGALRDISSVEDLTTNFVLVRGVFLKPEFVFSEKLKLTGIADYSIRDYLGDPASGTSPTHTNRVRTLGATLTYHAMRNLSFLLTARHEARTSNRALYDYDADIVSLTARLSF